MKVAHTIIARNSANGMASHIPSTPINNGSTNNPVKTNMKVLSNEIIAETFPFERAVNSIDVKILNPINKKLKQNMRNPSIAI